MSEFEVGRIVELRYDIPSIQRKVDRCSHLAACAIGDMCRGRNTMAADIFDHTEDATACLDATFKRG